MSTPEIIMAEDTPYTEERIYSVPEAQLLRLLQVGGTKSANKSGAMYSVPEEHFNRLMGMCATKNKCTTFGARHCKCATAAKKAESNA
jgi:hypothetical protein